MTAIWKLLSTAGAAIAAFLALFFYAKGKGKEEAKSEANKQIIDEIENRHKTDEINRNKSDDDILNELHNKDAD